MNDFTINTDDIAAFAAAGDKFELAFGYEDRIRHAMKEFARDVTERAHTRLYRPQLDSDAIRDVSNALYREGYEPEQATVIGHPKQITDLRDDHHVLTRYDTPETPQIQAHGMAVAMNETMPEDKCVAVHPEAIAPDRRVGSLRPWFVRHNTGIVTVVIHE